MAAANVKINFQVGDKDGLTLQEFLNYYPDIHLTTSQIRNIRDFLTAFCFSVLQEFEFSNDDELYLTSYLKTLVGENANGEWFITPLRGMRMFFRGLQVICIYNVTYYPVM